MDIKKQYMMLNDSLKKHAKILKNIVKAICMENMIQKK